MEFELSDEQKMIRSYPEDLAKRFDRAYWEEKSLAKEFPRELWRQLGSDGFLGIMVDEQYGGAGLGLFEMALIHEGLARVGMPLLLMVIGPTMTMGLLNKHGTEAQKQFYLPAGCSGENIYCFAITEPNAGSNSMRITTVARPDGDGFVLKGQKTYITGADAADHALVVARTTPFDEASSKTEGFTLFMVPMKDPRIEKRAIPIDVLIPEEQFQVFFDDVPLGPEHVVGEVGRGFSILFDTLNPERVVVAALAVGMGHYALEKGVAYASDREVFGVPVGSHQGLAHPMAAARAELEAAMLLTYQAAWAFDNGRAAGAESNMAKYFAAEACAHAVDAAVQAHGGNGFAREYGLFELHALSRILKTVPVSREMILNYIGERVLGLPRSY